MENRIKIEARRFPVVTRNTATGAVSSDSIIITKEQLNAAQIVGQSSKELIYRLYARNGFKVLDIGKAEKKTLCVNLAVLWDE